jgi:hypothetical protein
MGDNPWSRARTESPPTSLKNVVRERRVKKELRNSAGKLPPNVHLGSSVRISWRYDRAYGSGISSFEGTVVELDDWIKLKSRHGVHCHLPLNILTIEEVS